MKKIIIVNNNMKVGGVQKSLYNLLWTIEDQYDITLCLFSKTGVYADQLPKSVKVIECRRPLRYLGVSQGECGGMDKLMRGALALLCRWLGRPRVMKLLLSCVGRLPETYDCAVAYLHNGNGRNFYGGVQDFVLSKIDAKRKVAFLHCDYGSCGADHPDNNRLLAEFDKIAACSDGCRRAFEAVLPELAPKCVTVRNCHRFEEIRGLADDAPVQYDRNRINMVTVARLAHEKGVERAIEGTAQALQKGIPVTLHIVGSGAMEETLCSMVRERGLEDQILFYGEQSNPYRYMKNADLFLLTSYHEAAPMVLEEARCIGLPVLTTRTTSSREMVTEAGGGWVCENEQSALNRALMGVLTDLHGLKARKNDLCRQSMDNLAAMKQFATLIEG